MALVSAVLHFVDMNVPSERFLSAWSRIVRDNHLSFKATFAVLCALEVFVVDLFKLQCQPEAENLCLPFQLNIALRRVLSRLRLHDIDHCSCG
jgi:hypothetical protein